MLSSWQQYGGNFKARASKDLLLLKQKDVPQWPGLCFLGARSDSCFVILVLSATLRSAEGACIYSVFYVCSYDS